MNNKSIKIEELKKACEFLELNFNIFTNEKGEITSFCLTYPFQDKDTSEDEFMVLNGMVIKDQALMRKIQEVRECRKKIKTLQNEIKLLTKNQ